MKQQHFEMFVKYGKAKLDQYFGMLIHETPFDYAALVLHPSYKMAWFKDNWRKYPEWIKTVSDGMEDLVAEYGRECNETQTETKESEEPRLVRRKVSAAIVREREEYEALGLIGSDDENDIMEAMMSVDTSYSNHNHTKQARVESELVQWNKMELEKVDSPLRYWLVLSNLPLNRFPVLTELALDVFSIPVMSAECERVFSETKRPISDDRNQLSAKTIEAIQCQKNCLDNGAVSSQLTPAAQSQEAYVLVSS